MKKLIIILLMPIILITTSCKMEATNSNLTPKEETKIEEVKKEEPQKTPQPEIKKETVPPKETPAEVIPSATPTPILKTDFSALANDTNGWGFRRIKGSRPEFTKMQTQMMEKYNCIYMGSSEEKVLYLTFDEGYENGYTPMILDTLKEKQVPAAFFITGPYLQKQEELVKRMLDEGHIVGNHTQNHPSLPSLITEEKIEEEVLKLDRIFYEKFGKSMKYLRPPMGEFSERTLAVTNSLGYVNTFWSLAYKDWVTTEQKGKEYAFKNVTENLHNGAVILLHAVSKDNAEALGDIIDYARANGYTFLSLDEYK